RCLIALYCPCRAAGVRSCIACISSPPRFSLTDPATAAIYTLSLHDALPIYPRTSPVPSRADLAEAAYMDALMVIVGLIRPAAPQDRKSTRLNSSHVKISYAVFCLKKKRKTTTGIGADDTQ